MRNESGLAERMRNAERPSKSGTGPTHVHAHQPLVPFAPPVPQDDWKRIALATTTSSWPLALRVADAALRAIAALESRHGEAYLQLDEPQGKEAALIRHPFASADCLALVLTGTRSLVDAIRFRMALDGKPLLSLSYPPSPITSLPTLVALCNGKAVVSGEGYFAPGAIRLAESGWETFTMEGSLFSAIYGSEAP